MKTLGITSLDRKVTGQYRRLFRNFGLLMAVVLILAAAAVVYFDKRQVENLSRKLITSTAATVVEKLASFFEAADSNLRVAVEQLQMSREPDDDLLKKLFFRLAPFINQHPNANSIIITELNDNSDYLGILKSDQEDSELQVRIQFAKAWGRGKARMERWKDGKLLESWFREDNFDPRTRPWYKNSLEVAENEIVATEPYLFYPSNEHGITIATRWRQRDTGRQFITAIDISLVNITRFTQDMRPSENGVVFVFTNDLRLVGIPADERYSDEGAVKAALLQSVTDLDFPILQAGMAEWEKHGRIRKAFSFEFDDQSWWAGFDWIEDHPNQAGFWTGILIPESDFLGALSMQRNFSLVAIVGLGFLLSLILIVDAVRKIRSDVKEAVSHVGLKLGPFELRYKIGDGGNGTVYRADHALLKRPTAVKMMLPQFASSETAKQRFKNEVRLTSSLTHPNTVAVFDFGQTPEGTLYYAMEYLNGITLEVLARVSGPQPPARVLYILQQICGSLNEAHGRGLIHRDIKPSNIMLCERGGLYDVVKVLDFGLVKESQPERPELTQHNTIVGTPFYLAPELITDASAFSPLSDLYALSGVAYYLLTGRNVFEGTSSVEICAMHLHDEPVPPSQLTTHNIFSDLEAIVMACLAKEPADRPQGAAVMSEMLAQCQDYGAWTQDQAQKWWADNRGALPIEGHEDNRSPLADTHLFIDAGNRTRT